MSAPNMADVDSLELFNEKTGERLPVVPDKKRWPKAEGRYSLAKHTPDGFLIFEANGRHWSNSSDWIIRTKPEASPLPEPVLAYLRERAANGDDEAAKLLPVDPFKVALDEAARSYTSILSAQVDFKAGAEWLANSGIELAKAGAA